MLVAGVKHWLKQQFGRKPEFVYGTAGPDQRRARKHVSGRVEFIMWNAGEQGHTEDYWIAFHEYWWSTFTPSTAAPGS